MSLRPLSPSLLFVLFLGNWLLPKFCQDHFDPEFENQVNIIHLLDRAEIDTQLVVQT